MTLAHDPYAETNPAFATYALAEFLNAFAEVDETGAELPLTYLALSIALSEDLKQCERAGIEQPEPLPHPDDIILDTKTGGVRIEGPETKEQKARYDRACVHRAQAQGEVSFLADKYRRARSEKMKAFYLEEWHWAQRMFDIINDALAPRYKIKLTDRSYLPGASRQGETLAELIEERKKAPRERNWNDFVEG